MVIINGKQTDADGMILGDYLKNENYDVKVIAVERNGEIIAKERYDEIVIADGDTIEVVRFVGGG